MFRSSVCALAVAAAFTASARGNSVEAPATLTPDGGAPLPLAGQATRGHLLGVVEIYKLALYVNGASSDRAHLPSPDVAKALRIEITYKPDLRRPLTIDWQGELIPPLTTAAITHLRGTFASLKEGNVVQIEYVPKKGTTIHVRDAVVVSDANHDVMLAFLDHWLGQRPVSDEIKRALIGPA